jgi:serine/threonine protein kinase
MVSNPPINGLVASEVVEVVIENSHISNMGLVVWTALRMCLLISSLTQAPQMSEILLYRGFKRLLAALTEMRCLNLAHMDGKSDNIFVDGDGTWHLGDFGSCRELNSACWTFTDAFNPYDLTQFGTKVIASMDIVLLCVTIAVEQDKQKWYSRLCGEHERMQRGLVEETLSKIND